MLEALEYVQIDESLRRGVLGISLAHYGFAPLRDYRGTVDLFGRELKMSQTNIADALAAQGITVSRSQVWLDSPIKVIGQKKVTIAVHPEVETSVTVFVARSKDEADRIKRGEDISTRQEDQDAAAEALAAAGEFFDPEAQHDDEPAPAATEK